MAYKFPWTNYHELNLDWILDTVKELFAKTEQNNAVVEQYDGRLTEVELTADNAQTAAEQAQSDSAASLSLAQGAQTTATQAQQAAGQAQQAAGQAQTAAGQAQEAAATAQQTATQAQQTAQNFDGRITQAENNAASALQAAQAFDEQVQGALTAANNANTAATTALTTATETSRELAAQRSTLEDIIENAAESFEVDLSTKADVIINTASGDIASFNDGADDMPIKKLIVNIEPAQAGSGDPSPDNVRPISGWTGAEIEQTGKNLIDIADITMQTEGYIINQTIDFPSGQYVLSYYSTTPNNRGAITIIGKDDQRCTVSLTSLDSRIIATFNAPSGIKSIRAYNGAATYTNIQLELGSTASAYEPYQSDQISVNWEDEAGTVYGGTLTINPDRTGTLVADRAMVDLSNFTWVKQTQGFVVATLPDAKVPPTVNTKANMICSEYKTATNQETFDHKVDCSISLATIGLLRIYDSGKMSMTYAEFKAAMSGVMLCYELATPVTYQLTESEISGVLETLYGTNNIWADTGDIEVTYPADTKTYIDNKFAELQALILEH